MSFHTSAHIPGVFVPEELALLQDLIEQMRTEDWFPHSTSMREKFAAFVLNTYDRGMTCPAQLRAHCQAAAKLHFREPGIVSHEYRGTNNALHG